MSTLKKQAQNFVDSFMRDSNSKRIGKIRGGWTHS